MVTKSLTAAAVRSILDTVVDPEIPVLTIADIGVLRDVQITEDGEVKVFITPTYSGCPALDVIREDIRTALAVAGVTRSEVVTVYQPAWSTDWMTQDGRAKLQTYGIAPPNDSPENQTVRCPQCRSEATSTVSEFGSTACKALMVCSSCGEPFDYFKAI